tara:strand:+ start:5343 stop:6656 length:1314 start_codon:yes stop_codon:yes gene_type:complete
MQIMLKKKFFAKGGDVISGEVVMPGDKSISHRAVMCGALAKGVSRIANCLMGDDVKATIQAFKSMGVEFEFDSQFSFLIKGRGCHLEHPRRTINLQNSGTSIRLITGILAGLNLSARLDGDESLRRRPMERIATPLRKMGAIINLREEDFPPIDIISSKRLEAIEYTLPVASAQVKSAVIFASLFANGTSVLREPTRTRDHTERMLAQFGVDLRVEDKEIKIQGCRELHPVDLEIPGDLSSAAFFIVAAIIARSGGVKIKGVGLNPTRDGAITILKEMGAKIHIENKRVLGNEPVADILAFPSMLNGIVINEKLVASAIDEFPILFVAAACARGETQLTGAEELRHKESNRLVSMATNLRRLGISVELFKDGLTISGGDFKSGEIDAEGDHRVAMAFAVASLRAEGVITIDNAAEIDTSFPNFFDVAETLGLRLTWT